MAGLLSYKHWAYWLAAIIDGEGYITVDRRVWRSGELTATYRQDQARKQASGKQFLKPIPVRREGFEPPTSCSGGTRSIL